MVRHRIDNVNHWQKYVREFDRYKPPPLLLRHEYDALTPELARAYNEARRRGITNAPKYETPATADVNDVVGELLENNLYKEDPGPRSSVFLSAQGSMGKSTLSLDIAVRYERRIRQMYEFHPERFEYRDRWVPVCWLDAPAKLSIHSITDDILLWAGQSVLPDRTSDPKRIQAVRKFFYDSGVELLVVDNATRFKDGREADLDASNMLRQLMECGVTFIATGVDIRGSGILFDGKPTPHSRWLQTQSGTRYTILDIDPFTYDTPEDAADWVSHLRAVESDLLLIDKMPGMLSLSLAEFLFEMTNGVIGVLGEYVTSASTRILGRPVSMGGEYLTENDFLAVPVKALDTHHDDAAASRTTAGKRPSGGKTRPKTTGAGTRRKAKRNSLYNQPPKGSR